MPKKTKNRLDPKLWDVVNIIRILAQINGRRKPEIIWMHKKVKAAMTAAAGDVIGCMLAWPLTEKISSAFLGTVLHPDTWQSLRIGIISILISLLTASIANVYGFYPNNE